MMGDVVSSVSVIAEAAVEVVPPIDCTAVTVQPPSLVRPGRAQPPVLAALPAAGAPATKAQVTLSEPFVAVTVTLAPGMRLPTLMTGEAMFVVVSEVEPEFDAVASDTVGGPITVHDKVDVEVLPAASVAIVRRA